MWSGGISMNQFLCHIVQSSPLPSRPPSPPPTSPPTTLPTPFRRWWFWTCLVGVFGIVWHRWAYLVGWVPLRSLCVCGYLFVSPPSRQDVMTSSSSGFLLSAHTVDDSGDESISAAAHVEKSVLKEDCDEHWLCRHLVQTPEGISGIFLRFYTFPCIWWPFWILLYVFANSSVIIFFYYFYYF